MTTSKINKIEQKWNTKQEKRKRKKKLRKELNKLKELPMMNYDKICAFVSIFIL